MGNENNILRNIYTGSLYRVLGMPKQRIMDMLTVCQKVRRTRPCSLQSINWCVGVGGFQWAEDKVELGGVEMGVWVQTGLPLLNMEFGIGQ
jgi:hypothetical protein